MLEAYIISLVTCILSSLIAYGMSGEKSYFSFVDGIGYYVSSVSEYNACDVLHI